MGQLGQLRQQSGHYNKATVIVANNIVPLGDGRNGTRYEGD